MVSESACALGDKPNNGFTIASVGKRREKAGEMLPAICRHQLGPADHIVPRIIDDKLDCSVSPIQCSIRVRDIDFDITIKLYIVRGIERPASGKRKLHVCPSSSVIGIGGSRPVYGHI